MTYLNNLITYLVIYDIHFGHGKNPTADIIEAIEELFRINRETFKSLQTIFFTGDVFDKLIHLSSDDSILAQLWINRLIEFCTINDIQIRVLEGTPLHDRGQSKCFELLSQGKDVDVKYINTLSIEYNKRLDMNILYIPDEWTDSAEALEKEVMDLMAERSIEQVDIAMLHGLFEYQLPAHIPNLLRLSEAFFLRIVKGLIHIGHIHTHNPRGRIIPGGSVDRLAHNEEEDKGVILVTVSDEYEYEFIVNNRSKIFKTIDISAVDDVSEVIPFLKPLVNKLPNGSHVRLLGEVSSSVFENLVEVKRKYPNLHFTKKEIVDKDKSISVLEDVKVENLPVINSKTLPTVFEKYVMDKDCTTPIKTMKDILSFHIGDING